MTDHPPAAPTAKAPRTLTAHLRGRAAGQTLALLQDTLDAMKDAVALWDEDLKLILHNTQFRDMVLPEGFRPLQVGEEGVAFARELFHSGAYVMFDGTSPDELAERMGEIVRDYAMDMEIERTNGQVLGAESKRTALGGYLLTVYDKTDTKRAEAAEARKLEAVNDAVEALEEGFSLWDADMNFLFCNDRYMEIVFPPGFPRIEPGSNAVEVVPKFFEGDRLIVPEGIPTEALVQEVIHWITTFGEAREFFFKDGRVMRAAPHRTKLGGFLITVNDVTEVRNAEAKRLEAVNEAVGALDEGFILFDHDLNFTLCNPRFMELTYPAAHPPLQPGTAAAELMHQLYDTGALDLGDVSREDFAEQSVQWVRELRGPREYHFKDGRITRTRVTKTALGGYLALISDITGERNSEAKARNMLLDAFQSLDVGLVLCDENMNYVFGNDAWKKMMFDGFDRNIPQPGESVIENLIHHVRSGFYAIPEGMSEDDYIGWMMGQMAEHGKDVRYASADGRHFIGSSHQTSYGGALLLIRDVTEQRNAEARGRDTMLDAVQNLDEGLALFDAEMRFLYANDAWLEMFYPGRVRPAVGDHVRDMMLQGLEAGTYSVPAGISLEGYAADAIDAIKAHTHDKSFALSNGRLLLGSSHETRLEGYLLSFRDITDEQRAEEKRLEAVTDALNAADYPMVLFAGDRSFVLANKAWYTMIEPTGLHPQTGDDGEDFFMAMIETGYYVLPDGMSKAELHRTGLDFIYGYNREFPLVTSDGKLYLGSSTQTALGGYLVSYRDITEQTRTEQELAAQRELAHQNEKLSALGELLAGVAHELNNPLSVVFGYSQMLQGKVSDPVLAERIDLICQSAERSAKIVKTFLAMARQRPTKIEACQVNEIVSTALEVSSYSLKSNGTEVLTHFDPDAPPIQGDFDQLAQVFSNLIINAGHAVEPQREAGQIVVKSFPDAARGETVVEIRDNGPGIPKEIQKRIFEPFFTTKEVGEGTGVGLAFSHRIISSHNGALDLKSAPGKGTSFFVRLKAVSNDDLVRASEDAPAQMLAAKRVLVLDDEEGVAQLVHDLLADAGLAVTKATSPRDALRLVNDRAFDAILSDFKMPDMDGQSFFDAVEALAPGMARRIGFMTGDAMSAHVSAFFQRSGCPHIEKPIVKAELMALLAQITNPAEAQ